MTSHQPLRLLALRALLTITAVSVALLSLSSEQQVLAASGSTKTYSLFKGRAKVRLPKTANAPKNIGSSTFLVQPTDTTKKFAVYISSEPLRKDEVKMSRKQLGNSLKSLLEAQGYTIISFTSRGADYRVEFTTLANLPWQTVGTTPARGTAKFTRTADKKLIGTILMCEPSQWDDAEIGIYKQAVAKTKVSQR
jgi:hypothetical protein